MTSLLSVAGLIHLLWIFFKHLESYVLYRAGVSVNIY